MRSKRLIKPLWRLWWGSMKPCATLGLQRDLLWKGSNSVQSKSWQPHGWCEWLCSSRTIVRWVLDACIRMICRSIHWRWFEARIWRGSRSGLLLCAIDRACDKRLLCYPRWSESGGTLYLIGRSLMGCSWSGDGSQRRAGVRGCRSFSDKKRELAALFG